MPESAGCLRVSTAWTLLGHVVYAGCQWGILVTAAKLGTPAMVGQLALAVAVTAPVVLLVNLQLRAVQATDAGGDFSFGHYLAMRLVTTAFAIVVIIAIAVFGPYRGATAATLLVVGLAKSIESISDVCYGLLQRREQMARIAQSMMLKGGVSVLAFAAGLRMSGEILGGAAAMAVSLAMVVVAFDLPMSARMLRAGTPGGEERWAPSWNAEALRRLLELSLPLGIAMMLLSLNSNVPRYFIEHEFGQAQLGLFAAVASLMVAGAMIVNALGQSASPRMANYYAAGDRRAFVRLIRNLTLFAIGVGCAGVVVAFALGSQILAIVFQPLYAAAARVFAWMMLAGAVSYAASVCGYGVTASRRFAVQLPLSAVAAAATTTASYLLIPPFGLTGAAWAVGIGATVQLIGAAGVLRTAVRAI